MISVPIFISNIRAIDCTKYMIDLVLSDVTYISRWIDNAYKNGASVKGEYCFTSPPAESWQYRDYALLLFRMNSKVFIVHSNIGSPAHSMPLSSLEQCICTITMKNIRPDWDSNPVSGYKPQSIRMSHRGRRPVRQTIRNWMLLP